MNISQSFNVSLLGAVGHEKPIKELFECRTPFDALKAFCLKHNCEGYSIRDERPEKREDGLYKVWSAGCSISGLRVWISTWLCN